MTRVIPLAEGDLRWVFPKLEDPTEVLEVLLRADAQMRRLAGHLGVRPGQTDSGLEFGRYERGTCADLEGFADNLEVCFSVDLCSEPCRQSEADLPGPPWVVDAEITMSCDGRVDCAVHYIEELPEGRYDSPLEAARGLLAAASWLLERGTTEPLSSWRQRDPLSRHGYG